MDKQNISKTDEEWKKVLTPDVYTVLRKKGTERAFSGKLWDNTEKGIFVCAGCGTQLFTSDTKFESGTGWPSFDQALPGAVEYEKDESQGMVRTEVKCAHCGGHLGHMFNDGPSRTTGKRYCINSVCLNLKKN